jgi:hypothetical protein
MPGGMVFDYKCDAGHKLSKNFPPRTEYDKHAQLICPECLKADKTNWAYLIFAYPEAWKKSDA